MPVLDHPTRPLRIVLRALLAPALWLERARGRRRLALLLLYTVLLSPFALWGFRASRLQGLPDIGDPFDVQVYLASKKVPEDQDATALYRKAWGRLRPSYMRERQAKWPTYDLAVKLRRAEGRAWGTADDEVRGWLEMNREALELWRRGTERSGTSYDPDGSDYLPALVILARLEALRRDDLDDTAGVWAMRRAVLRFAALHTTNGPPLQVLGYYSYYYFVPELTAAQNWSDDPRVGEALLRKAIADLLEMERLIPPASDFSKREYLEVWRQVDEATRADPRNAFFTPGTDFNALSEWDNFTIHYEPARRLRWFLANEPERSRRLLRLVYDDWLSQADRDPKRRPARATEPPWLYGTGSRREWVNSAALPRRFAEPGLAPWYLCKNDYETPLNAARAQLANLIVHIAEQLYWREHGKSPASAKALVGPYLKRLPDGYVDPADAGAAKP